MSYYIVRTQSVFNHSYIIEAESETHAEQIMDDALLTENYVFFEEREIKNKWSHEARVPDGVSKITALDQVVEETEDYLKERMAREYSEYIWE